MSHTTVVEFSDDPTASIHSSTIYPHPSATGYMTKTSSSSSSSSTSSEINDYEIKTEINDDLPFLSKKQLIQFRPTHHDTFHSSNFNGPSFKQIIFAFILLVFVTSLCSYLYKDSLVNVLLILETLPWWWTAIFFCILFALVSLPFAWGRFVAIKHAIDHHSF